MMVWKDSAVLSAAHPCVRIASGAVRVIDAVVGLGICGTGGYVYTASSVALQYLHVVVRIIGADIFFSLGTVRK